MWRVWRHDASSGWSEFKAPPVSSKHGWDRVIQGDWIISSGERVELIEEWVLLNGSLIITDNSTLYMYKALIVICKGPYNITIRDEGSLIMIGECIEDWYDDSIIYKAASKNPPPIRHWPNADITRLYIYLFDKAKMHVEQSTIYGNTVYLFNESYLYHYDHMMGFVAHVHDRARFIAIDTGADIHVYDEAWVHAEIDGQVSFYFTGDYDITLKIPSGHISLTVDAGFHVELVGCGVTLAFYTYDRVKLTLIGALGVPWIQVYGHDSSSLIVRNFWRISRVADAYVYDNASLEMYDVRVDDLGVFGNASLNVHNASVMRLKIRWDFTQGRAPIMLEQVDITCGFYIVLTDSISISLRGVFQGVGVSFELVDLNLKVINCTIREEYEDFLADGLVIHLYDHATLTLYSPAYFSKIVAHDYSVITAYDNITLRPGLGIVLKDKAKLITINVPIQIVSFYTGGRGNVYVCGTYEVRVKLDGEPVAGAEVIVYEKRSGEVVAKGHTGPDGSVRFVLVALGPRAMPLYIIEAVYGDYRATTPAMSLPPPTSYNEVIVLPTLHLKRTSTLLPASLTIVILVVTIVAISTAFTIAMRKTRR